MTKKKISQEEYRQIEEQSIAAKELLEGGRFAFFREYLQSTLPLVLERKMWFLLRFLPFFVSFRL